MRGRVVELGFELPGDDGLVEHDSVDGLVVPPRSGERFVPGRRESGSRARTAHCGITSSGWPHWEVSIAWS